MAYNLLNDIDETLRQERLTTLWKEWRTPLLVGLIAAVVTLVGIELWRSYTAENRAVAATSYWQATQAGADAESQFAAVAEGKDPTYRAMARLQLASLKPNEANKYFEEVAHDGGAPRELRDLANLQLGQRLMVTDGTKAQAVLQDLASAEGPFYLLAYEMLGILAEDQGKVEEAKSHYAIVIQKAPLDGDMMTRVRRRHEALGQ